VPKTLAERVESLEKASAALRELPARVSRVELRVTAVEEQVLQLRGEMRDGFSAVLDVIDAGSAATQRMFDETRALVEATRAEAKDGLVGLREEMRMEFGAVHTEFANVRAGMSQEFANVRAEMSQEFANVRAEMSQEFTKVRADIGEEFVHVRTQMRVLHEDLVERIARIGEGRPQKRHSKKRNRQS
jgi:isocitrate/isopropylmalate dehydrogenase